MQDPFRLLVQALAEAGLLLKQTAEEPKLRKAFGEAVARTLKDHRSGIAAAVPPFQAQSQHLVGAGGSREALKIVLDQIEMDLGAERAGELIKELASHLIESPRRPAHRPEGDSGRGRHLGILVKATGGAALPRQKAAAINTLIVHYLMQTKPWPLTEEAALRRVQVARKGLIEKPTLFWEELSRASLEPEEATPEALELLDLLACREILLTVGEENDKKSAALLVAQSEKILG